MTRLVVTPPPHPRVAPVPAVVVHRAPPQTVAAQPVIPAMQETQNRSLNTRMGYCYLAEIPPPLRSQSRLLPESHTVELLMCSKI